MELFQGQETHENRENFGYFSMGRFLSLLEKCQTAKELKCILAPVIVGGLVKDLLAVSKVITLCFRIRKLKYVDSLLMQLGDSNPFIWNTVIRGYEQSNNPWKAINLYGLMSHNDVAPDKFTFPFILKACGSAHALKEGEQIHCRILKSPLRLDLFIQGSLIFLYSKCGNIEAARASFDVSIHKNLISWNTMIDGYIKHGNLSAAVTLFEQMPERDIFSWNTIIDGYTKYGHIEHARWLFDEMPERDNISWNIMIDGYTKSGDMKAARELFDLAPFKDVVCWGIMINGYAQCGQIGIAHCWFEKTPYKNMITWNSLINGYVKCNNIREAHKVFEIMPCKNLISWNLMLDGYAKLGDMEFACRVFDMMPMKDVFSWNILIDGHARLGRMKLARELFDTMPCRDVVSWNAMLAGYKQNGQLKEVVELFTDMCSIGEKVDYSTLAIVLSVVADLGLFSLGKWIHAYVNRNNFPLDSIIGVGLIDMYSKCGYSDIAKGIFDIIPERSIDHWNAMISGFAVHGWGRRAISLFEDMEPSSVKPDDITFIGILNACSHAGLVHEGHQYFELMTLKYGITPKIQHYGCMVDLLSRAGHLDAAVTLVNNMPMRANDIVWRALLGASTNHGNIEVAEHAARHLIELVPEDSSSYVLLSNIYGYKGQSENARDMWRIMKERGVVKNLACSSVELQGVLHEFTAGDTSHPQIMELLHFLNNMAGGLMQSGYVPNAKPSLLDISI